MVLGLVVMSEDTSLILILPLNVFTEWLHPLGRGQSSLVLGAVWECKFLGICGLLKGLL